MSLTALPSKGPLTNVTSYLSLPDARALGLTCQAQNQHFNSIYFWKDRFVSLFWRDAPNGSGVEAIKHIVWRSVKAQEAVEALLKNDLSTLLPYEWRELNQCSLIHSMGTLSSLRNEFFAYINDVAPAGFQKIPYLPQLAVFHKANGLFDRVVRYCQRFDPDCLAAAHMAVEFDQFESLEKLIPLVAGRRSTMVNGISLLGRAVKHSIETENTDLTTIEFLVATLPAEERWHAHNVSPLTVYARQRDRSDIIAVLEDQPLLEFSPKSPVPYKARRMVQAIQVRIEAEKAKLAEEAKPKPGVEALAAEVAKLEIEVQSHPEKQKLYQYKLKEHKQLLEDQELEKDEILGEIKVLERQIQALYPTD